MKQDKIKEIETKEVEKLLAMANELGVYLAKTNYSYPEVGHELLLVYNYIMHNETPENPSLIFLECSRFFSEQKLTFNEALIIIMIINSNLLFSGVRQEEKEAKKWLKG